MSATKTAQAAQADAAPFTFLLDGREVEALPGETIFAAARRAGIFIPHLCHRPEPGYAPKGVCRACMVAVEGERRLLPACRVQPKPGWKVLLNDSEKAVRTRQLVFELLLAEQPDAPHDPDSALLQQAARLGVDGSRFATMSATSSPPPADASHPAFSVRLDACIHCGLCRQGCVEVQGNDVIGLAFRGARTQVVFDCADALADSSCVACGECVQACPTGALLPKTLAEQPLPPGWRRQERETDTVCPFCGVGCQIRVHVRDGRVAWAEGRNGPANENRLCVKGRFGLDYVHHPQRLTKPLIRKSGAPKEMGVDPANPFTHFREASWEEALDAAAAGLKKALEQHGPAALAGFGSAKGSNEEAYLFQKLVRSGFGNNNVDHCTRLCHASSVAALMEQIGSGAVTAPFTHVLQSDVIFLIGANPVENHPVAATYIKQAARAGAKLIVADPRGQVLARDAALMLQHRPGSDVALLNGIMHVILREGLTDEDFIRRRTRGWEEMKAHLKRFPPQKMAALCGVPAADIERAARLIGKAGAVMFLWGMGISQHVHGTDNARSINNLALMTGNIGKPGAGLHPLRGQNNVQGASDCGLIPMVFPDYQPVSDMDARARLEALWGVERLDDAPGLTVVEIMHAIEDGTIRAMYIMGENPAMSDPDLARTRKALASLEHLVVQDIFLTETAMFADVVLPATTWLEKEGTVTNTNRTVQMGRPALPPPGDARPDWWIIQQIAQRLGLAWDYAGPAEVFAEMQQAMPSLANITWERLQREDAVTYPCPGPDEPGREIVFDDAFPTEDGLGRFSPADILPPDELPDNAFPFILTTGRVLEHWHTGAMTRRASVLEALQPQAYVAMNPQEMERLGIAEGDMLEVATRRGAVRVAARADARVPEGVLFMPFAYVEAAANILTNPALDPFGRIPEFKFAAAAVRKAA